MEIGRRASFFIFLEGYTLRNQDQSCVSFFWFLNALTKWDSGRDDGFVLRQWTSSCCIANLLQPLASRVLGLSVMGLREVSNIFMSLTDISYDKIWIERITSDQKSQLPFNPYPLKWAICCSQQVYLYVFIPFSVLVSSVFRIEFYKLMQQLIKLK